MPHLKVASPPVGSSLPSSQVAFPQPFQESRKLLTEPTHSGIPFLQGLYLPELLSRYLLNQPRTNCMKDPTLTHLSE